MTFPGLNLGRRRRVGRSASAVNRKRFLTDLRTQNEPPLTIPHTDESDSELMLPGSLLIPNLSSPLQDSTDQLRLDGPGAERRPALRLLLAGGSS